MTTAVVAALIPMPSVGAEILRSGGRSTLHIQRDSESQPEYETSLMLGRNSTTGISDPRLSRRMARIEWQYINSESSFQLCMQILQGQGFVQVNDSAVTSQYNLQDGDVIALIASNSSASYKYRVQFSENQPPTTIQPDTQPSATVGVKRTSDTATNVDASQEFACAVCLDIMVEATTAVPCGHSFCRSCFPANVRECPTCRTRLTSRPFPSRQLDTAIALLIQNQPDLFSADDVAQYYTRSQQSAPLKNYGVSTRKKVKSEGSSAEDAIVID